MTMRLNDMEFQDFRERFAFLHWPDEDHRAPVEIVSHDSDHPWTVFLSQEAFHNAADWLHRRRIRETRR